jgi:hypothetical protein
MDKSPATERSGGNPSESWLYSRSHIDGHMDAVDVGVPLRQPRVRTKVISAFYSDLSARTGSMRAARNGAVCIAWKNRPLTSIPGMFSLPDCPFTCSVSPL